MKGVERKTMLAQALLMPFMLFKEVFLLSCCTGEKECIE
jgi:hypothetical protein